MANLQSKPTQSKRLAYFLVLLCMFGAYTKASLIFSYDTFVVPGLIAFALFSWRYKSLIFTTLVYILFVGAHLVVLISLGMDSLYYTEQLFSLGLFVLSMFAVLGYYCALSMLESEALLRLFVFLLIACLVGIFAERLGLLGPVNDIVRYSLYDEAFIANNPLRDITTYGFVRPTLFASEPSNVAKFYGSILGAYLVLSRTRSIVLKGVMAAVSFVVLLPSVSFVFGLISGLFGRLRYAFMSLSIIKRVIITVVFLATGIVVSWYVANRLGLLGGKMEVSAYARLVFPFRLAAEAIRNQPIFGYGLAADSSLLPLISEVYKAPDTPVWILLTQDRRFGSGSLHFAVVWQFGLVGVALFYWMTFRLLKALTPEKYAALFVGFLVVGFAIGNFHTPVLWSLLIPIAVALNKSGAPREYRRAEQLTQRAPVRRVTAT